MKKAIKSALFLAPVVILLVLSLFFGISKAAPQQAASSITLKELEISNSGILPSNPFYFFKRWSRDLRRVFTFDYLSRAELELNILNEKAGELSKLLEIIPSNDAAVDFAVGQYLISSQKLYSQLRLLSESNQVNLSHFLNRLESLGLRHIQLLDDAASYVNNQDQYEAALNGILNNMAFAIERLDNSKNFYLLVQNILDEGLSPEQSLRFGEALDKLENKLPDDLKASLSGVKESLLINFAAKAISGDNFSEEVIKNMSGDRLARLRVFDELRLKIQNTDVKSRANLLRQVVLQEAETAGKTNVKSAAEFISLAKAYFELLESQPKKASQMKFYINQAEKFYEEDNYAAAVSQASIAIAVGKISLRHLSAFSYDEEINLIKAMYDRLSKSVSVNNGEKLLIIEEKIINLSDFLKKANISPPSEKVENSIIDIKFLLLAGN